MSSEMAESDLMILTSSSVHVGLSDRPISLQCKVLDNKNGVLKGADIIITKIKREKYYIV